MDAGAWAMRPTLSAEFSRWMAVAATTAMSVPVTVVTVDESGVLKRNCAGWTALL
jgi:hypothetical protein